MRLLLTVATAASLALTAPASAVPMFQGRETRATVVGVIDGDTVKVRGDGRTYRIQLFAIEAPDEGACFYEQARAGLRRLLPRGSTITFESSPGTDDLGRFLADAVTRNGVRIDHAMARRGLAEVFEDYEGDEEIMIATARAQTERRGLFGACTEWPLSGTNHP